MRNRNATQTLIASPVLVGAVTVLITIVAVFIAYNANQGLPFVPTYDLKAVVPSGNKLVPGNEVRVGGFRVGVVSEITPRLVREDGRTRSVAVLDMKLDKTVQPLATDSTVRIRPRSALGLKYVEMTPGKSKRTLATGSTLPLKNASEPLELEDVFATLDGRTRRNVQASLDGFGDAFAGRGQSINTAIQAFNPFFASLTPVMQTLNDPDTGLDEAVVQLGAFAAQLAPVAQTNAELFGNMATTFTALSEDPTALRQTIERSPSTLDTAVSSFRTQRPFLADATDLSRRLRPAVQELPRSLPAINTAFRVGTPVLPRTVRFNDRLEDTFGELDDLVGNPNTLLAFRDLRSTFQITRPALEYIAPYQTVCSYVNYFLYPLGEHQSQVSPLGGTVQQQGVRLPNFLQANSLGMTTGSRPVDVLPGENPIGSSRDRFFASPQQPAIDSQGNADCQLGQNGLPRGPAGPVRYSPGVAADGAGTGANGGVSLRDYPIQSGGTYVSRRLGINNLRDVDKLR